MAISLKIYSPFDVDIDTMLNDNNRWVLFEKKLAAVPESIKNILILAPTISFLQLLSFRKGFTETQSADVSRIVRDTLLGDRPLSSMVSQLSLKLNIDTPKATIIANEIVENLFMSALEDIKRVQRGIASGSGDKTRTTLPTVINQSINQNNVIDLKNK